MAFCRLIAALSETDPGRKGSLLRRAETITAGRLMLPAGGSPMGLENERRALGVLHGAENAFFEQFYTETDHFTKTGSGQT
jgi:hypothetical protein